MPVGRTSLFSLCRSFATSSAKPDKTSVVFLHFGQPRTEYYAKDFLSKTAQAYYNIPDILKGIISSRTLLNDTVRKCVTDYENRSTIEEDTDKLAENVKVALQQLVPEYSDISITSAFLYEGGKFQEQVESAITHGASNVILFPLYSHYSCLQSGLLLNAASFHIYKSTIPSMENGRPVESVRVRPSTNIQFKISAVHRWNTHPFLVDMWSTELLSCRGELDGIVFAAPVLRGNGQKEYAHSVWASCERVSDLIDHTVPWKLGFYNSWTDWSLPITDSVNRQISKLAGKVPHERRIAVVPVTEFMSNFNTFSVLPTLLQKSNKCTVLEPQDRSKKVIQGIAEILKHHLLGRRNAQIQEYCDTCVRRDCEVPRLILE